MTSLGLSATDFSRSLASLSIVWLKKRKREKKKKRTKRKKKETRAQTRKPPVLLHPTKNDLPDICKAFAISLVKGFVEHRPLCFRFFSSH
jgi:hypothetical protein